jgi:hypothetical protein
MVSRPYPVKASVKGLSIDESEGRQRHHSAIIRAHFDLVGIGHFSSQSTPPIGKGSDSSHCLCADDSMKSTR